MYFGSLGWRECSDDRKDAYIQFLPDSIIYDGQTTEVITYHNELLAIENGNALFHEVEFQDLGFQGDYFWNLKPFSFFLLLNDTELTILSGRAMYKAEKIEKMEEYKSLEASNSYSMCYGS